MRITYGVMLFILSLTPVLGCEVVLERRYADVSDRCSDPRVTSSNKGILHTVPHLLVMGRDVSVVICYEYKHNALYMNDGTSMGGLSLKEREIKRLLSDLLDEIRNLVDNQCSEIDCMENLFFYGFSAAFSNIKTPRGTQCTIAYHIAY